MIPTMKSNYKKYTCQIIPSMTIVETQRREDLKEKSELIDIIEDAKLMHGLIFLNKIVNLFDEG